MVFIHERQIQTGWGLCKKWCAILAWLPDNFFFFSPCLYISSCHVPRTIFAWCWRNGSESWSDSKQKYKCICNNEWRKTSQQVQDHIARSSGVLTYLSRAQWSDLSLLDIPAPVAEEPQQSSWCLFYAVSDLLCCKWINLNLWSPTPRRHLDKPAKLRPWNALPDMECLFNIFSVTVTLHVNDILHKYTQYLACWQLPIILFWVLFQRNPCV